MRNNRPIVQSCSVSASNLQDHGAFHGSSLPFLFSFSLRVQALGSRTPVPYFFAGQALLGTGTGSLLGASDDARREWSVVDHLLHPICCMVAPGQSPSSVMH